MEKTLAKEKSLLREKYRRIRNEISDSDRDLWNTAIASRVLELEGIDKANVIFAYLARSGEVGTKSLVSAFLKQGKLVLTPSPDIRALPHDGLFRISSNDDETTDQFSAAQCHESRIDEIDIVLVPGIVWDRRGYRIGFGGGYFDRLLSMARKDCRKIGLAYECQIVEKAPQDPWDEPVDVLVTEK